MRCDLSRIFSDKNIFYVTSQVDTTYKYNIFNNILFKKAICIDFNTNSF